MLTQLQCQKYHGEVEEPAGCTKVKVPLWHTMPRKKGKHSKKKEKSARNAAGSKSAGGTKRKRGEQEEEARGEHNKDGESQCNGGIVRRVIRYPCTTTAVATTDASGRAFKKQETHKGGAHCFVLGLHDALY